MPSLGRVTSSRGTQSFLEHRTASRDEAGRAAYDDLALRRSGYFPTDSDRSCRRRTRLHGHLRLSKWPHRSCSPSVSPVERACWTYRSRFFLKNRLGISRHREVATFRLACWHSALPVLPFRACYATPGTRSGCVTAVIRGPLQHRERSGHLRRVLPCSCRRPTERCLRPCCSSTVCIPERPCRARTDCPGGAWGRQHAMSGQISAVWNIFAHAGAGRRRTSSSAAVISQLGGEATVSIRRPASLAVLPGELHPASLVDRLLRFGGPRRSSTDHAGFKHASLGLRPLCRFETRLAFAIAPIYPALLRSGCLWNFAPGSTTPLQYYLQNTLHARPMRNGVVWNAIFAAVLSPDLRDLLRCFASRYRFAKSALLGHDHRHPAIRAAAVCPRRCRLL